MMDKILSLKDMKKEILLTGYHSSHSAKRLLDYALEIEEKDKVIDAQNAYIAIVKTSYGEDILKLEKEIEKLTAILKATDTDKFVKFIDRQLAEQRRIKMIASQKTIKEIE